jgi:hypothetical protein
MKGKTVAILETGLGIILPIGSANAGKLLNYLYFIAIHLTA